MADQLKKIDPVKVREARQRVEKINQASDRAIGAAQALNWFAEFVDGREARLAIDNVMAIKEYLKGQNGHSAAMAYIDQAHTLLEADFIQRVADAAIAQALADLAAGEHKK